MTLLFIFPPRSHNSEERYNPPKCHPHTREAITQDIMDWIEESTKITIVILGFCGCMDRQELENSAIVQTIAELRFQTNLLSAIFFFSSSVSDRNRKTFLITTIVDQLIVSIPEIREHVGNALFNNPSLLTRSLEAQMDALFVKFLEAALAALPVAGSTL
jgi:hypothetical protein